MPEITADDITRIVKDALYVTVGAGVIGVQKAQVRRRELTKALTAQLAEARGRLDGVGTPEELLEQARTSVQRLVDSAEEQLKAVEDRLTEVEDRYDAGDGRVVQRWRYSWDGGHVRGVDLFLVRDGRIAEKRSYVKG